MTSWAVAYVAAAGIVGGIVLAVRAAEAIAARRRKPPAVPPPRPAVHPGRPVDGNALTPGEEDALAGVQFMVTRYPLVLEPERPAPKG